jgi:hypothetical protein
MAGVDEGETGNGAKATTPALLYLKTLDIWFLFL